MLVEHSPDAICVHRDGLIVYMNRSGQRYLRAESREEILGRPITDFIAPSSIGPMLARIASLDAHGVASEPSEAEVVALDGSTLSMEAVSVRTSWNGEPAFQVILRDLTEHKAAQQALRYQAALVTHVSDAIVGVSADGLVTSWNPAAESIYGRTSAEVVGRDIAGALGVPCDPSTVIKAGGRVRDTHLRAGGSALSVTVSAAAMGDGFVLVCADQSALRRAEEHFTAVVESLDEGVVVLDHAGRIASANLAAKSMLGIRTGLETAGRAGDLPFSVYGTDERPISSTAHPVAVTKRTRQPSSGVIGIERRWDGRRFWLSLTATLLNPDDATSSIVAAFSDITEHHHASMELEFAATHDHLTGLPNRTLLLATLDGALNKPNRHHVIVVLFIDVDNFKTVNDTFSHAVGDAVLGVVAQRLTATLPQTAIVGRIGGDEFVAVVPAAMGTEVDDVRNALAAPMTIDDRVLAVAASVGRVSVAPGDARGALEILNAADLDMYQAKPVQQRLS